jgi:hypothetical protein
VLFDCLFDVHLLCETFGQFLLFLLYGLFVSLPIIRLFPNASKEHNMTPFLSGDI